MDNTNLPSGLVARKLDPVNNIDDAALLSRVDYVKNSGLLDMMMNAAFGKNTVEVVDSNSIRNWM